MKREDSKDTKNNGDTSNTSKKNLEPNSKEDSTQVADPVKAFREDMEMEGYTGTNLNICIK